MVWQLLGSGIGIVSADDKGETCTREGLDFGVRYSSP